MITFGLYSVPNESAAIMLSYCFREIIRNAFEHAKVEKCSVMAQHWANGFTEIAIADRGIGILDSLGQAYSVSDAPTALNLALQPGVSSALHMDMDSQWANTGFGLYLVSELGRRYGNFSIISSEYFLSPARADISQPIPLKGTLVKLRLNTADADYWPNILESIVKEGEGISSSKSSAVKHVSKIAKLPGPS